VPSRPPDHRLSIRHGHNVRRSPIGVNKRIDDRLSAADVVWRPMTEIATDP
jgi:hypothetical protein